MSGVLPDGRLPRAVVFDLDYTLWPLWVDTHVDPPLRRRGSALNEVIDQSGLPLSFYPQVPSILFALRRAGILVAAASRTAAPKVARQALSGLYIKESNAEEAVPALSLFDQLEIYPGSKKAHLAALKKKTGIEYDEMVFFDDKHRNAEVTRLGVHFVEVGMRGMDIATFQKGIRTWSTSK